jgi:hypothetical protein
MPGERWHWKAVYNEQTEGTEGTERKEGKEAPLGFCEVLICVPS